MYLLLQSNKENKQPKASKFKQKKAAEDKSKKKKGSVITCVTIVIAKNYIAMYIFTG